jgi:hypothetical protein
MFLLTAVTASAQTAKIKVAAHGDLRNYGPGWQAVTQLDSVSVVPAADLLAKGDGILIISGSRAPDINKVEQLHAEFADFLNRGGTIIFGLTAASSAWDRQSENSADAGKQREERRAEFWDAQLGTLMPVNPWTAFDNRLKRLSSGAFAPAGSPLADALKAPGFRMDWRFDLHLPYSTIEAGQHRYEPAHFGKLLWNTDWQVWLNSDQSGQMPLLVAGRYGAGKSLVFAGDLFDATLSAWEGYPAFLRALLAAAAPETSDSAPDAVDGLKLTLATAQPGGPLTITVTNPSAHPVTAVLAVKIRNLIGSVRNAATQPLKLAANASQKVTLPTVTPYLRADLAERSADRAGNNILRVEAGLASTDRRQFGATVSGLVDLTPPLTLTIEGEDINAFEKVEGWTVGAVGFTGGNSVPVERYTYFSGDTPKLKVRLANARHNLAPLAKAADHARPDNLSVEGLNDTAYSYENVRNKQPAVFGFWAGLKNEQNAQQLSLTWPLPVTAVAQRIAAQSEWRKRNINNPQNFTLHVPGADEAVLNVSEAVYTYNLRDDEFTAPAVITSCTLTVTGLDPKSPNEPRANIVNFSHNVEADKAAVKASSAEIGCAIDEWEIYGWPARELPPAVSGILRVTLSDPAAGTTETLLEQPLTVEPLREQVVEVPVPTRQGTATLRVDAVFIAGAIKAVPPPSATPASPAAKPADSDKKSEPGPVRKWLGRIVKKDPAPAAVASLQQSQISNNKSSIINASPFPIQFIPPGREHILTRDLLGEVGLGLLCSPGFTAIDNFGMGANEDIQGWGGPDDKVWAWAHDMMEIGSRNKDQARYFYLSSAGLTHYTYPFRDFPDGRYVWDWVGEKFADRFTNDRYWQGKKTMHVVGSDRWNGIPIGASFTWANYIRFDQHLRAQGRPGLQGRTRTAINKELTEQYADEFQRYELNRYADEVLAHQQRLADIGVRATFESHGSFPLSGGEVGAKLGKTHKAVGTDLFWEFRDEDLYKSLGYRYGIIAANPDFESGAYNEWGWVSGVLANSTWYSTSGDVEPSRRQWYSTYYAGRVTSSGEFKPYTIYGFSNQGSPGTKMTLDDWRQYNRVQSRMIWQRPERPVGIALIASWQLQENRMTPEAGPLGFGLYAGKGYDQVNEQIGELYYRLVRNGLPVSLFASTHTLKQWHGTQPLVVADGFELDPWEFTELERLNKGGAPVIAIGSEHRAGRAAAEQFFGVTVSGDGWAPAAGTQLITDRAGKPLAYRNGTRLFCPVPIRALDGQQSQQLTRAILDLCGDPLTVTPAAGATVYANDGSLYLILGSQSDQAENFTVSVNPRLLDPAFPAGPCRVIDLDRVQDLPTKETAGTLTFTLPCAPNDGRLIQILPVK